MWMKIELAANSRTAEVWQTIQNSFENLFVANGAPEDASMHFASSGRDVTLYLSPGAVAIFDGKAWGAQRCAKPASAILLVGHDSARIA